jgi:hypothetical protein
MEGLLMTDIVEKVKEALAGSTPGPWGKSIHSVLARGSSNVISGAILGSIAHCTSLFETDSEGREWWASGTPEANARLIALAPDMARALIAQEERLKAAEQAIEALAPMLDDDPSLDEQKEGRAVLANYRATGGSNE